MISLDALTPLRVRSSTDGYQAKFILEESNQFVKLQAKIGNKWVLDPYVEVLASTICCRLGIPHVPQSLGYFAYGGSRYLGAASPLFKANFVSYRREEELHGKSIKDSNYASLAPRHKLEYLADSMARYTNGATTYWTKYFTDMVTVDILVCNTDRHFHNFGSFNHETPAFLFDFGMGCFVPYTYNNYEQALSQAYIEPYSEDPFDLIDFLSLGRSISVDLRELVALCPDYASRRYFKEVCSIVTKR